MTSIMRIDNDGDEVWELNGEPYKYHREGGLPAVICYDGLTAWWVNGKTHRTDGPACIDDEYICWYINGEIIYSAKKFQELTGHSDEYMAVLIMKYGYGSFES